MLLIKLFLLRNSNIPYTKSKYTIMIHLIRYNIIMDEDEKLRQLRENERNQRVTTAKNRIFKGELNTNVKKRLIVNIKTDYMEFFPKKQTEGSCGYDLYSSTNMNIGPNESVLVPTSIYMELPLCVEAQIRPRSSSLLKGLLVGFGTIDSDFRGEICVIIRNLNNVVYKVNKGDRFAQLCFAMTNHPILNRVTHLNSTTRGTDGFGSTGTNSTNNNGE